MTSIIAHLTTRPTFRDSAPTVVPPIAIGCLSVMIGRVIVEPDALPVAAGVVLLAFLAAVAVLAPVPLLYTMVVWLVLLGLARRLARDLGIAYEKDPLLLIGPTLIVLLLLMAARRGAFNNMTALAATVLALNLLFLLSVVNPLQGSAFVGLAGLLFTLVPMLGFWIGRGLVDRRVMENLLKLGVTLAVLAAGYGMYQVFHAFPSWDLKWIAQVDYASLYVFGRSQIGTYRPFGTLASAAEFVLLLAVGVVVCWSYLIVRRRMRIVLLAAAVFLLIAIVYGSSRSVVFTLAAGLALTTAARRGLRLSAAAVLAGVLLILVPSAVSPLLPVVAGGSPLVAHQIEGLTDPLNPETSTLRNHLGLVEDGLQSAIRDPLGHGAGSITLAADRFGSQGRGTEADPSNVGVALGIPGLVVFLALFGIAFRSTYTLALIRRDPVSLGVLGILTVTSLQWLNGGHYALSVITWLALGWSDRILAQRVREGSESSRTVSTVTRLSASQAAP